MPLSLDTDTIHNGIRLAVAPVFLLTAVSGMIGAVVGRLARIIDRARKLEEQLRAGAVQPALAARLLDELHSLRTRGRLTNVCVGLLTLCAFAIGLTIILLFLGETTGVPSGRGAMIGFLAGVGCFLLALLCFLWETWLATRVLNFHTLHVPLQAAPPYGFEAAPESAPAPAPPSARPLTAVPLAPEK